MMLQEQKADSQVIFEQQRAMIEQQKAESLANINVLAEIIKTCKLDSAARSEQARKDNELRMIRQEAKEKTRDAFIKRYGNMLKNILSSQPNDDFDLPIWLTSIETIFELQSMPLDLRATLLLPYLNTKAKMLVCLLTPELIKTYDSLKQALLREFRLTPKQYRTQFLEAKKKDAESYVQYNTRITTIFQYYMESRNVKDMKTLVELIIFDKLKDSMPYGVHDFVVTKEANEVYMPTKLAELADLYNNEVFSNRSKQYIATKFVGEKERLKTNNNKSDKPYNFNKNSNQSRPQQQNQSVKCYNCNGFGHIAKNCLEFENAKAHQIIIEKSGVNLANDDNRIMCDKNETNRSHIENDDEIIYNNDSVTELNAHSVIIDKLSDTSIKDSNVTDKHVTDYCPTDTLDLSWLWADNIDRDEDRYGSRLIDQISPIVLSDVNVKVSKPETVTVRVVNQPINCIVDSGAEITVVRQSKLPNTFLQNINNDCQSIMLKAAL